MTPHPPFEGEDDNPFTPGTIEPFPDTRPEPGVGDIRPSNTNTDVTPLQKTVLNSAPVLVCTDCDEWYKNHTDWEVCPKCGTELTEVERA